MPSKKQYNLVNDDAYDSRIPLYNEEAFQHGISFHAKYIGSLDVPRPSSRIEIVAAMRRIRYEFKAKSIKKRKVTLTVSVDGVKVIPRNKKKNNRWPWEENKFIILHHPIYRIFYVSHDSQDLKIFSYIARDSGTNSFKCNVFKSKKKSQAMRIVRTVGQAFEVCHKLSLALATSACEEAHSLSGNEEVDALHDHSNKAKSQGDGASEPNSCDTQEEQSAIKSPNSNKLSQHMTEEDTNKKIDIEASRITTPQNNNLKISDPIIYQHIQLLKDQLQLQNQQLQTVMTQIEILRDQLTAEKSARIEAQDQNHLLLVHNRELLEHIQKLVNRIYEIEGKSSEKSYQAPRISEPFNLLPPPVPDAHLYLENLKYLSGINKSSHQLQENQIQNFKSLSDSKAYSAGHLENHFAADPITKSSFQTNFASRSSLLGPSPSESANNPKSGLSLKNTGLSLPTSPSNFSPSLDTIFKPDSFVCSSPKQSRKIKNPTGDAVGDFLIPQSPSFSQSSTSPVHNKKTFDFEDTSATSSLFNYHENPENVNSHSSSYFTSRESNVSNKDSFIAQVTRDLAKMSTVDQCISESPNSKSPGNNFSLFRS